MLINFTQTDILLILSQWLNYSYCLLLAHFIINEKMMNERQRLRLCPTFQCKWKPTSVLSTTLLCKMNLRTKCIYLTVLIQVNALTGKKKKYSADPSVMVTHKECVLVTQKLVRRGRRTQWILHCQLKSTKLLIIVRKTQYWGTCISV